MVWHDGRYWDWNPWAELERWTRAFEVPSLVRANVLPTRAYANGDRVELHVAVPGRAAGDVDLSVEDDVLTVKVSALAAEADAPERCAAREIPRQAVERRFQLPWSIEREDVRATLKDGLLKIELARAAQERPRTIPIQAP